jgi:hypothetical protein
VLLAVWLLSLANGASAAEPEPTTTTNQTASQTCRLAQTPSDAKAGLGAWIWSDKSSDHQICRFWKDLEIPAGAEVVQAKLRIAVDDGYQLYLDGRELAQAANWRAITEGVTVIGMDPAANV